MPYDRELGDRLREALTGRPVTEKRMFGALAFLVDGHIAVAASGSGGLLVRVPPEQEASLRTQPGVGPFVMRGREAEGWVHVDGPFTDEDLRDWVDLALERLDERYA